ncbi:MAG: type III PLP-dependent enzyme [Hyphomicrobiales bacterium]|nr:type III PLP-dependent enzyme [Hyphomicrobiales bacterium]MCP5372817.1 type III PLP-dependent enzyme [Hyphomicrobiales bacterium]
MTPKIAEFLNTHRGETPFLVVDLDKVESNYRDLRRALPLAEIYYAVKANPAAPVLGRLVGLESSFDAASFQEVEMCLAAGADPAAISYGNTVKKARDIARAFAAGVRLFAFDSAGELEKLAEHAPGSRVFCRILTDNGGADWPLSRKFGCHLEMARDLMLAAAEKGLKPHGISFHVGSQQTDPSQWEVAIGRAAMVFTDLRRRGIEVRMLNLGGGFPARYRGGDVPPVDAFADAIMKAMTKHFGNDLPAMIIEPGRSITAEAGVLQTEVVLVSRKSYAADEPRWVYFDIGKFGGLAETMDEAIRYPVDTPYGADAEMGPVIIAGPTCDGADILYEHCGYQLPMALKPGDKVQLLSAGAYTTTYASQGFNGFPPLSEHYI